MEARAAVSFLDQHPVSDELVTDVTEGLSSTPKTLSPKFFYDAEGSRLFDSICRQPEYYPTRTEKAILRDNATAIASYLGTDVLLVEPGAGSTEKVRLLLDAVRPHTYMPMDISREHLYDAARRLSDDFPWLNVCAACADFTRDHELPQAPPDLRRVVFFPGSTIGNFEPSDASAFLSRMAALAGPGGGLLIGVDVRKDAAVLNAAYNDRRGVTAAFNRNVLVRINREIGGDFRPERFRHHAFYNRERGRVEMHLVSTVPQTVRVADRLFGFAAGESIHTENSYKYGIEAFQAMAAEAGFRPRAVWRDREALFSVHYLEC